jgi:ClpP class serine protease
MMRAAVRLNARRGMTDLNIAVAANSAVWSGKQGKSLAKVQKLLKEQSEA